LRQSYDRIEHASDLIRPIVAAEDATADKTGARSLRLSDPRDRAIGSLRVPRVDVEFVFQRYELADINAFMSRFHAHFRRGGG
jgi:hypothetical protein